MSATVIARLRAGVSQRPACATSHARLPVVAAPAVIAPAMHCMHMRGEILRAVRPPLRTLNGRLIVAAARAGAVQRDLVPVYGIGEAAG